MRSSSVRLPPSVVGRQAGAPDGTRLLETISYLHKGKNLTELRVGSRAAPRYIIETVGLRGRSVRVAVPGNGSDRRRQGMVTSHEPHLDPIPSRGRRSGYGEHR
jgi:hypothetical protein